MNWEGSPVNEYLQDFFPFRKEKIIKISFD